MKKIFFVLLLAIVGSGLFAQATDAQIRQAANTLGVPYEALKKLVDSYKSQNGPSGAIAITIDDPRDIPFLHNDPRIKVDETYVITVDAWFRNISSNSRNLVLYSDSDILRDKYFQVTVDFRIPDFERGDPVRVVFSYKPNGIYRDPSIFNSKLVSIQKR